MTPEQRDPAHLWDIVEAAKAVRRFTEGVTYHAYLKDRMVQAAVEREVEIIGEAARRLSEGFKEAHPEVPWARIIAQRNVLAHEYGEIKQDRMYAVATEHVPALIETLEQFIPPLPPEVEE